MINDIYGIRIYITLNALKDSEERLFPESRHRSRRIRKKLIKRHGGVFKKVPCIWSTPQGFYVHPSLYVEFKRQMSQIKENLTERITSNLNKSVDQLAMEAMTLYPRTPSPKDVEPKRDYMFGANIRYGYGLALVSHRGMIKSYTV